MYCYHLPETQSKLNANSYSNMYASNFKLEDCNNGKPFKDTTVNRQEAVSRQLNSVSNYLPLDQSYELMNHIPSVADDWKNANNPHCVDESLYAAATTTAVQTHPFQQSQGFYPNLMNQQNAQYLPGTNSTGSFYQNQLGGQRSPPPVAFSQNTAHSRSADSNVGTIKRRNPRQHNNDVGNLESVYRKLPRRSSKPVIWEQTASTPRTPLANILTDANAVAPAWPTNSLVLRDLQNISSPKSPDTHRLFFGNDYVSPIEANENLEALIKLQQQIAPRKQADQLNTFDLDSPNDESIFDGFYDKERLIDLFKELTDDMKQSNAELASMRQDGLEDINMDDFAALIANPSMVRQEMVQFENSISTSDKVFASQKLPSFATAFLQNTGPKGA